MEIRRAPGNLEFLIFGKPLPSTPVTWATSPTTKFKHAGTLLFEIHRGSYAYQPELIIALESPKYPDGLFTRPQNNGMWRMEVCVPLRTVYEALMEALPEMAARLQGVKL